MPVADKGSRYRAVRFLLIAVAFKVCSSMLLPVSHNFTRVMPTLPLTGCYAASFYCLTFALNKLPIAVV